MKKRCYNSGKITGLSDLDYILNFLDADDEIKQLGYNPISPLDKNMQGNIPWWLHITLDVMLLLTCRTAYFQRNWKDSRGARIEHRIAKFFRMKIIYQ